MPQEKQSGKGRKTNSPRKHRTHGYRGYGSGFGRGTGQYGGAVHWGSGFGGVGAPSYGGATLPSADLFRSEVWEPGPYSGLSPRGYVRSDERIREEICEELTRSSDIDPRRMTVAVEAGEVSLEGTVEDALSRSLVEEIAGRCAGVKRVHNRLRFERPRSNNRPD